MIDWLSSNRLHRNLSPADLAEQQIMQCDNETIRRYAVAYATERNAQIRRSFAAEEEQKAQLESFRAPDRGVIVSASRLAREMSVRNAEASKSHLRSVGEGLMLRLSASFLGAKIVIGGSESVTWGDASLKQLRERRASLVKQFEIDAVVIARLDVAIGALEQHGAETLRALAATGIARIGVEPTTAAGALERAMNDAKAAS